MAELGNNFRNEDNLRMKMTLKMRTYLKNWYDFRNEDNLKHKDNAMNEDNFKKAVFISEDLHITTRFSRYFRHQLRVIRSSLCFINILSYFKASGSVLMRAKRTQRGKIGKEMDPGGCRLGKKIGQPEVYTSLIWVHLHICQSVWLLMILSVYCFGCLSAVLYICRSVQLICQSVCMYVGFLSVHLS